MLKPSVERTLLFVLTLVSFGMLTDLILIVPLGNLFTEALQITPQQFTVVISAYKLSAAVVGLTGALVIDRFSRKAALIAISAGFLLGMLCCMVATSYTMLIVARIIAGGFGGLITALLFTIVGDVIPYQRRGKAMGMLFIGAGLASVLGVSFGLYLSENFQWQAAFIFIAIVMFLAIVLAAFGLPLMNGHIAAHQKKQSPFQFIYNTYKSYNARLALALALLLYVGPVTILMLMPAYLVKNVGMTQASVKLIYLLGGALNVAMSPLVGFLADRFGKHRILYILIVIMLVVTVVLTHLPPVSLVVMLATTSVFYILANSRMIPGDAMITATVADHERGGFMSVISAMQQMMSGLASLAVGFIITEGPNGEIFNYNIVGYLAVLIGIASIFVVKALKVS